MLDSAIAYILLALLGIASFFCVLMGIRDRSGIRHLISANSLISLLFIVYIFIAACLSIVLNDSLFTWAPLWSGPEYAITTLLVCIVSVVVYAFTYGVLTSRAGLSPDIHYQASPEAESSGFVLHAILIFGLLLKLYAIIAMGGIQDSFARMTNGLSEIFALETLDSSVAIVKSFSTMADFAATALLVSRIKGRNVRGRDIAVFAGVCALTYFTSGKRTFLLEPICAVLVAISIYRHKIKLTWLPLAVVIALFGGMVTILFRSVFAAEVNNIYFSPEDAPWARGSVFGYYFYSLEFSFFEAITTCIYQSDEINGLFGGTFQAFYTTNLEPILYAIPRSVWAGKPTVFYDYSHGITAAMFELPLIDAYWGTASSFIGTSWAIGGLIGLVGYSIFLGVLSSKADIFLFRAPISAYTEVRIHVFSVMLFSIFVLWRQGSLGYSFMSIFTDQIGYIVSVTILFASSIFGMYRGRDPAEDVSIGSRSCETP